MIPVPDLLPFEKTIPLNRYNRGMARGWESKSVEAQQDEAAERSASQKPRLTREEADRQREKESLRLSLQRVIRQLERSNNPRHRTMLEHALADLQHKIQDLAL